MVDFRVQLDIYRGPLDLLLYLVRKHEVEIEDIPIATITDQYVEYLEILEQLDVNTTADFLDLASTLVEIKSRAVLPQADEVDEPLEDPREQLVERLLEYKRFKDAATILEEQSRQWQLRFPRQSDDLPPRRVDPAEQPIHEVELWDLVSALGRVMKSATPDLAANIVYDETPVHVYMERMHERLAKEGRVAFSEFFSAGMHKSAMIGVFLAILELVRHHRARTEQDGIHGEIWVIPGEDFQANLDLSGVDNYESTFPMLDEDEEGAAEDETPEDDPS